MNKEIINSNDQKNEFDDFESLLSKLHEVGQKRSQDFAQALLENSYPFGIIGQIRQSGLSIFEVAQKMLRESRSEES